MTYRITLSQYYLVLTVCTTGTINLAKHGLNSIECIVMQVEVILLKFKMHVYLTWFTNIIVNIA